MLSCYCLCQNQQQRRSQSRLAKWSLLLDCLLENPWSCPSDWAPSPAPGCALCCSPCPGRCWGCYAWRSLRRHPNWPRCWLWQTPGSPGHPPAWRHPHLQCFRMPPIRQVAQQNKQKAVSWAEGGHAECLFSAWSRWAMFWLEGAMSLTNAPVKEEWQRQDWPAGLQQQDWAA